MSNTQLTGQIGTILDNLPQLLSFTLNNNNLTGSLPALTNSRKLQSISLVNNKLSGILPTSWSVLTGMTQINLQTNNGLTGTLPSSWSGMRLLQTLNLSGGSWFGQIPSSWFPVMTGMRDFIIPNGSLDGPVPAT
jgi:Leucine-rich repeat (LRR) protein